MPIDSFKTRITRMWQESVKNIGEYWFGLPTTPKVNVVWKFSEPFSRIVGIPKYMLARVPCDNALFLKSNPKITDENILYWPTIWPSTGSNE